MQEHIQATTQETILEHIQELRHTQERMQVITLALTQVLTKDFSRVIPEASSVVTTQELTQGIIQAITQELKTIQAHTLEHTQEVIQVITQELQHIQEHTLEHTQVTTQEHTQEIQY